MPSNQREAMDTRAIEAGRAGARPPAAAIDDYLTTTAPAAHHFAEALEDRALADRLLALPRSERQRSIESDRRYHRLSLGRLFALAAEQTLLDDSNADAEPEAELAAGVVVQLPGDAAGKVQRTAVLAHWLLGKARLRCGSWQAAAQAFETIYAFIPNHAPSRERGLCAYGHAQLYADVRNDEAAIGMATLAAQQFWLAGAAEQAAACHAQVGLLLQESGVPELAAAELLRALRVMGLDPGAAPSLTARLLLALACVEATLGHTGAARQRLRSARRLYELADSPAERLERDWREAQAEAAAGRLAEADRRLDQVRRRLLEAGSPAEAAQATLDHALVRLDAGRVETVEGLAAALAAAFPGDGEAQAQQIAELAWVSGADGPGDRQRAGQELRRRLRQTVPLRPGLRPALIVPWRMLTDRLLRGHAEGADPSGAPRGTI
jgi:alpha-D-ribose 1-methylphosphonate 5-triphosphate synthase subunit PhnG